MVFLTPLYKRGDKDRAVLQVGDTGVVGSAGALSLSGCRRPFGSIGAYLKAMGIQIQSKNSGLQVSVGAGVGEAAEGAEDEDVAGGDDVGAGIDVAEDQDVARVMDQFAGTAGVFDYQGVVF